jgi:hypothetical protein
MNGIDPQELISAYLDGELTPDERAEAERLLESSSQLRADLEDFSRLSDLIRALPRESAPPELAAAIRAKAEEQSLLAARPVMRRSFRREIVSALVGGAVTAAAWLMMVQTHPTSGPELPANRSAPVAARGEPSAAGALAFSAPAAPLVVDLPQQLEKGVMPATKPAEAESKAMLVGRRQELEKRLSEIARTEGLARDGDAGIPAGTGTRVLSGGRLMGNAVRIGDVVPYLEKNTNGVAVLELTVVDIAQVADQLQYLCSVSDISLLEDGSPRTNLEDEAGAADAEPAAKGDATSSGLVFVYVQAPSSNMLQFLEQIDERQDQFVAAQLQPPMDLPAAVEEEAAKSKETVDGAATEWVKEEATELVSNYVIQRQSEPVLAANSADAAGGEKLVESQRRRAEDKRNLGRAGLNRSFKSRTTSPPDQNSSEPADAFAAIQSTSSVRQQNVAVTIPLNAPTDNAVAESALRRKLGNKPSVDEKLGVKAKRGVADRESEQISASGEGAAQESPPLVRLLVVLRQAAPDAQPPE